eukprot:1139004-Rhodomonas_salina.1
MACNPCCADAKPSTLHPPPSTLSLPPLKPQTSTFHPQPSTLNPSRREPRAAIPKLQNSPRLSPQRAKTCWRSL